MRFSKSRHLTQKLGGSRARYLVAAGIMVVFGGLGVYLLRGSKADVAGDDPSVQLSLAPANATVAKGDVINIAVNVDTSDETVKTADATVQYSPDVLQLQSANQVCPEGSFDDTAKKDVANDGSVSVACNSDSGISGEHTLATLTFKAIADSNDAAITINDNSSTVQRKSDGARVRAARHRNAKMNLVADAVDSKKTPRTVTERPSRQSCPRIPGQPHCNAAESVNTDGTPVANAAVSGYGPKEFHMAYQMPCTPGGAVQTVCSTPSTYGPQTIVITDAGSYSSGASGLESDLTKFSQQFGIPPCTIASGCLTVMDQRGGSTVPKDAGWSDEIAMDTQAAHAMCQTCKIVLIQADNASTLDGANDYAASLKPVAISNSWSGGTGDENAYKHPGIPQIIATGDDGILNAANSPNDYPEIIAASGTTLKVNTDGTRASETLWDGSGAGCSPTNAAPSWQTSLSNWGSAGCGSQRAYGDMTAVGDPSTGMAVIVNGKWGVIAGTSLSAPLLAGMIAVSGGVPANSNGADFLYGYYKSTPSLFFDIASGSDCTNSVKTHCTAGPGYDVPSGLGSPVGVATFKGTGGGTTPPTPTPPTPTPPTPTPPTPTPPTGGPKTGDINGDNKVNLTDLSILLKNYNKAGTSSTGDLNSDGKVNLTDLSILLKNWGK